jgi:hypothetical protein
MSVPEDITKIPRKVKDGTTTNRVNVSIYIDHNTNEAFKAVAKEHRASISGLVELAMVRLLADIDTAKAELTR